MNNLGKYLKKARKSKNLTLLQLQEKSGVSNSHISRIERGLREPSPETLKKISSPLGIPYEMLLEKAGYLEKRNKDKIKSALSDDQELADFWDKLKEREDLKLLFKQTKDMSPEGVRQIIRIIKAIEAEEQERFNS